MSINDKAIADELTAAEQWVIDDLPGPPALARIASTNLWIIEWLPGEEQQTGWQIHNWTWSKRPKWSKHCPCQSKDDVINAISQAIRRAEDIGMIPILHLEADGNDAGLVGPCAAAAERLTWSELCAPLQKLNFATRCNLLVVIAACTGFAGIQAFYQGPYAPAVALAGPDSPVMPGELLRITKEFYRCLMDEDPRLSEMAASASREFDAAVVEWEPFAVLAYEALVKSLVISLRPDEQMRRKARLHNSLSDATNLPQHEINRRLDLAPVIPSSNDLQRIWDEMFMIEQYPDNIARFGVDWRAVRESATVALSQ